MYLDFVACIVGGDPCNTSTEHSNEKYAQAKVRYVPRNYRRDVDYPELESRASDWDNLENDTYDVYCNMLDNLVATYPAENLQHKGKYDIESVKKYFDDDIKDRHLAYQMIAPFMMVEPSCVCTVANGPMYPYAPIDGELKLPLWHGKFHKTSKYSENSKGRPVAGALQYFVMDYGSIREHGLFYLMAPAFNKRDGLANIRIVREFERNGFFAESTLRAASRRD
jgi:hypothetical protein